MSDTCLSYDSSFDLNFYISLALCIGIFISYVPQHIRIIHRKSSEGISPWFLLLGITSGFCAFFNILLISKRIYQCCEIMAAGKCFAASMGILQITVQSIAATLILVFALIFTRHQTLEPKEEYYKLQYVGKICLCFFVIIGGFSLYLYKSHSSEKVNLLANSLGVLGAILAGIQYFPQIYTTSHLQHVGSLSIPMMLIQTPGGFIWSASLAAREDTKWSSWLPYLTAASLQGILLVMAIYFEMRNRRFAKETRKLLDESEPNSETPLLL